MSVSNSVAPAPTPNASAISDTDEKSTHTRPCAKKISPLKATNSPQRSIT